MDLQVTILEREGSLPVTDLPEHASVLIGHLALGQLDLCVDVRKGVIYNPYHDNDWIEEAY